MEAMLGFSLYSYLYLELGKNTMSSLLSLNIFSQQNQRTRRRNRFCPKKEGGGGEELREVDPNNINNVYT
jgi:hypothetical protein